MTLLRSTINQAITLAEYYLARLGREARDETGAMSTEAVALAAGLVAAAIAVAVIFKDKAAAIAESIPETGFGG